MQSEATAAATVPALKETILPMGPTVSHMVLRPGPDRASSSRYLETMKRL